MHFTDPRELGGLRIIGSNGAALGVVDGIYTDVRSGHPQWAAIKSWLFGTDVSIIPLYATERDNRTLRISYCIQELRDAPHRAPGTAIGHEEEANPFRHYGVGHGFARPSAGKAASPGGRTRPFQCACAGTARTRRAGPGLSGRCWGTPPGLLACSPLLYA